jgi:hypothetical protein
VCGLFIALMMKAASISETLVNFYQTTQCYDPEDSHLLSKIFLHLNSMVHDKIKMF